MVIIDEKVLTEVKEANEVIAKAINERLLDMVDQIIKVKDSGLPEQNGNIIYNNIFPYNYPEYKKYDKLMDLRTLISDRRKRELDSVSKYMLHMIIESISCLLKEVFDSTILPFESRPVIAVKLYSTNKYKAKEVVKIIACYEDLDNYIEILFETLEFLDLEDMDEKALSRIELQELVRAKQKEKMAPML